MADIEHKKFLKIHFGLMSTSSGLIQNKNLLKEYAEELDWIVETDKEGSVDENGIRYYEINVKPNKSEKISPEEYRKIKDKVEGFAVDLWSQINANNENASFGVTPEIDDVFFITKPEKVKGYLNYGGILFLEYNLIDRIELENISENLAKFIFEEFVWDYYDRITIKIPIYKKPFKKKLINDLNEYLNKLDDMFGIKLDR